MGPAACWVGEPGGDKEPWSEQHQTPQSGGGAPEGKGWAGKRSFSTQNVFPERSTCRLRRGQITRRLALQDRLRRLRLEEEELLRKIQEVRAALSEEDALQERLKQLAQVSLPQLRPPSPRFG